VQHLAKGHSVSDAFSYQATDGLASSNIAALAIAITGVNDSPHITSDGGGAAAARSIPENTTAVTTVTAADPDVGASLTYAISGGADSGKLTIDSASGALRFIAAPDFEVPSDSNGDNVYEVHVEVSDGSLTDTQVILITVTDVAENQPPVSIGPACGDMTALVVQGTAGRDRIHVIPHGSGGHGAVKVKFNADWYEFPSGSFTSIAISGKASDDVIALAGTIDYNACLFGDAGNDIIQGGAGDDILVGGDDNDKLHGGQGRDLVIGGKGADHVLGQADDDILIAGYTDYDADENALGAIMAEWTRTDLCYYLRVFHLWFGGGANGGVKLTNHTVHDDAACDRLTGADGIDWFFANLDCNGARDWLTDDRWYELTVDID
jgi:Ca2+-binding RTX toxin-like protein